MTSLRSRPGVTLVELMLFVALMAIASGAILGFLLLTADSRIRQSARADVQQVAVQLQQMLTHELRAAESVLLPARASTGTTLVWQAGTQDGSPVVLSVVSGALLMVRGQSSAVVSPPDITMTGMLVTNLSSQSGAPSAHIRLLLRKRVALPNEEFASATLDIAVSALPTDDPLGDVCSCAAPSCSGGQLQWETCVSGGCVAVEDISIACP